jgi:hypothetical protein
VTGRRIALAVAGGIAGSAAAAVFACAVAAALLAWALSRNEADLEALGDGEGP